MVCLHCDHYHVLRRWLHRFLAWALERPYFSVLVRAHETIPLYFKALAHPGPTNRYLMIFLFPVLFFGWKFIHKTKWRTPENVDLLYGKDEVDEYERTYVPVPPRYGHQPPLFLAQQTG